MALRIQYPDRLANPHRIGLTDLERAEFVPGTAIKTPGVRRWTDSHMNLTRTLADYGWCDPIPGTGARPEQT